MFLLYFIWTEPHIEIVIGIMGGENNIHLLAGLLTIKLLECPIPALSSSSVCHKKSGSLLFLLYFSNLVKWISPKLQTVFLTT